MIYEPRALARLSGRRKPTDLLVMVGYGIAALGFLLLPTIILTPIAPAVIVGGFAFSLGAHLAGRFRLAALRKIRHGEREPHHPLLD